MSNDFVKSLLIVEDDSVIASAHRKLLEDNGYEVLIAESGEKAIEKIQSDTFDLILMDIDLGPGIDGTETARKILNLIEIRITIFYRNGFRVI